MPRPIYPYETWQACTSPPRCNFALAHRGATSPWPTAAQLRPGPPRRSSALALRGVGRALRGVCLALRLRPLVSADPLVNDLPLLGQPVLDGDRVARQVGRGIRPGPHKEGPIVEGEGAIDLAGRGEAPEARVQVRSSSEPEIGRRRSARPRSRRRSMRAERRKGVQFSPSGKRSSASRDSSDCANDSRARERSSPAPDSEGTKWDPSRVKMRSIPGSHRRAFAKTMRGSRPPVRDKSQATARESAGPACREKAMRGRSASPRSITVSSRTSNPAHRFPASIAVSKTSTRSFS